MRCIYCQQVRRARDFYTRADAAATCIIFLDFAKRATSCVVGSHDDATFSKQPTMVDVQCIVLRSYAAFVERAYANSMAAYLQLKRLWRVTMPSFAPSSA